MSRWISAKAGRELAVGGRSDRSHDFLADLDSQLALCLLFVVILSGGRWNDNGHIESVRNVIQQASLFASDNNKEESI